MAATGMGRVDRPRNRLPQASAAGAIAWDQPMVERVAFLNGEFVPASRLAVPCEDLGFLQGVTISERLRTFHHRPFRLADHFQRLKNSLQFIGLDTRIDLEQLAHVVGDVIDRNLDGLAAGDDLGVSLFVTPGPPESGRPTIGVEAYPLPFRQWVTWYEQGQSLAETGIQQVPASCWPSALKCRSRIHYYRADQLAEQRWPGSRPILLDQEGYVTESSTANIVIYRAGRGLISPPLEKILPGVSLAVVAELAAGQGLPFEHADFRLDDIATADEVLMCSTSPCLWTVAQLNGRPVGRGGQGPVYQRVLGAWSELVGLDIVAQAHRFATR